MHVGPTGPLVPPTVMAAIQAYGDSRADDDGLSPLKIYDLIRVLRQWATDLQQQQLAQVEPAPTFEVWFDRLPPGRQAVLQQDKWMLARAAWDAARAQEPST